MLTLLPGCEADARGVAADCLRRGREDNRSPIVSLANLVYRNEQLLGVLFTNSALKTYYRRKGQGAFVMSMYEPSLSEQIEDTRKDVSRKINVLRR